MITLTDRAAARLRQLQAESGFDAHKPVRLLVEAGGCSGLEYGMSFDDPKPDDARTEALGLTIVLDPVAQSYLEGARVDFDDGLHGKGFEIQNPNAKSTCGCGRSFS